MRTPVDPAITVVRGAALLALFWVALIWVDRASEAFAREGDLIEQIPFASIAPQDIAYDPTDGTYWVTAFLDNAVVHYSADLFRTRNSRSSRFDACHGDIGIRQNSKDQQSCRSRSLCPRLFGCIGRRRNEKGIDLRIIEFDSK